MCRQCLAKIKTIKIADKMRLLLALSAILIISACAVLLIVSSHLAKETVNLPVVDEYDIFVTRLEKRNLKLGVVSGPYGDMFKEAIEPSLAQKGYTVELVVYDSYAEPNFALTEGKIDLNMFQHYMYLNNFKFAHNLDLTAITEIPTAAMSIFSFRHTSLEKLPHGAVAAVPADATNLARAFILLENAGIITIDPHVDKTKAVEKDLVKNPKNLQFAYLDAQDLAKSLNEYDLAVINGNFAISGGLNLSDALAKEVLTENYINVIAVKTKYLDKQFVRDILEIVHSDEYKKIVTNPNGKYAGFQRPRSLLVMNKQGGGT